MHELWCSQIQTNNYTSDSFKGMEAKFPKYMLNCPSIIPICFKCFMLNVLIKKACIYCQIRFDCLSEVEEAGTNETNNLNFKEINPDLMFCHIHHSFHRHR